MAPVGSVFAKGGDDEGRGKAGKTNGLHNAGISWKSRR